MIKIVSPIILKSLKCKINHNHAFEQKIIANYDFMLAHIKKEELLHLLAAEPEHEDAAGMTTLITNMSVENNNEINITLMNQLINRIMDIHEHRITYQDRVYISCILNKMGIMDVNTFMLNIKNSMNEVSSIIEKYKLYQMIVEEKKKEHIVQNYVDKEVFETIINRIQMIENTDIIYKFNHINNQGSSFELSHSDLVMAENVNEIRNLQITDARQTITQQKHSQEIHVINPYELNSSLDENIDITKETVLNNIMEAAVFHLVKSASINIEEQRSNAYTAWVITGSAICNSITEMLERYRTYHEQGISYHNVKADVISFLQELQNNELQILKNISVVNKENSINHLNRVIRFQKIMNDHMVNINNRKHNWKDFWNITENNDENSSILFLDRIFENIDNEEHNIIDEFQNHNEQKVFSSFAEKVIIQIEKDNKHFISNILSEFYEEDNVDITEQIDAIAEMYPYVYTEIADAIVEQFDFKTEIEENQQLDYIERESIEKITSIMEKYKDRRRSVANHHNIIQNQSSISNAANIMQELFEKKENGIVSKLQYITLKDEKVYEHIAEIFEENSEVKIETIIDFIDEEVNELVQQSVSKAFSTRIDGTKIGGTTIDGTRIEDTTIGGTTVEESQIHFIENVFDEMVADNTNNIMSKLLYIAQNSRQLTEETTTIIAGKYVDQLNDRYNKTIQSSEVQRINYISHLITEMINQLAYQTITEHIYGKIQNVIDYEQNNFVLENVMNQIVSDDKNKFISEISYLSQEDENIYEKIAMALIEVNSTENDASYSSNVDSQEFSKTDNITNQIMDVVKESFIQNAKKVIGDEIYSITGITQYNPVIEEVVNTFVQMNQKKDESKEFNNIYQSIRSSFHKEILNVTEDKSYVDFIEKVFDEMAVQNTNDIISKMLYITHQDKMFSQKKANIFNYNNMTQLKESYQKSEHLTKGQRVNVISQAVTEIINKSAYQEILSHIEEKIQKQTTDEKYVSHMEKVIDQIFSSNQYKLVSEISHISQSDDKTYEDKIYEDIAKIFMEVNDTETGIENIYYDKIEYIEQKINHIDSINRASKTINNQEWKFNRTNSSESKRIQEYKSKFTEIIEFLHVTENKDMVLNNEYNNEYNNGYEQMKYMEMVYKTNDKELEYQKSSQTTAKNNVTNYSEANMSKVQLTVDNSKKTIRDTELTRQIRNGDINQMIQENVQKEVRNITNQVYQKIEKKLQSERKRRGM